MTEEAPKKPPPERMVIFLDPGTGWGRFFLALLGLCGAGFMWLVANFAAARPVLEHPFSLMVWSWGCFVAGGLADHLLIARPQYQQRKAAEGVIKEFRTKAEAWSDERAEMREKIGKLTTQVEYLTREVERLSRDRSG